MTEVKFSLPGGMKFGIEIDLNDIFACLNLETNIELFPPWKEISLLIPLWGGGSKITIIV